MNNYECYYKLMKTAYERAMSGKLNADQVFFHAGFINNYKNIRLRNECVEIAYNKFNNKQHEPFSKSRYEYEEQLWNSYPEEKKFHNKYYTMIKPTIPGEEPYESSVYVDKVLNVFVPVKDWTKYCTLDEFIEKSYTLFNHTISSMNSLTTYAKENVYYKLEKYFDWTPTDMTHPKYDTSVKKYTDNIFDIRYWPKANWSKSNMNDNEIENIDNLAFRFVTARVSFVAEYYHRFFSNNYSIFSTDNNDYEDSEYTIGLNAAFMDDYIIESYDIKPEYHWFRNHKFLEGFTTKRFKEKFNTQEDIDFYFDYLMEQYAYGKDIVKRIPIEQKKRKIVSLLKDSDIYEEIE